MDNVLCTGNESELAKCRFDGWGRTDCRSGEAAGVICGGDDLPNATLNLVDKQGKSKIRDVHQRGIAVRLAGPRQGRLEIKLPDSGEDIVKTYLFFAKYTRLYRFPLILSSADED